MYKDCSKAARGFSIFSFLLIVVFLVAIYAGAVYLPLFFQNYEARHSCQEALNSSWRREPKHIKEDFLRRVHQIATVEREVHGSVVSRPAIDPGDRVFIEKEEMGAPPFIWLEAFYEREVTLPLTGGRTHVFYFETYCVRDMK